MSASTKLSAAVKALSYLSESYPEPRSSAQISRYTGVNASKLRKLLSLLVKEGIVKSEQGNRGGFKLNKNSNTIDLQEIYCAIEDRKAFHLDVHRKNSGKATKKDLYNNYFLDLFSDIQVDIENKMKKIKLNSIMKKVSN